MKDSLGEALDAALAPGRVRVARRGVTVEVDVVDVDRLGVSVERIGVRGAPGGLDRLPEALAPLDRLRVVEADPGLGGGLLRGPVRRAEFYEARVDGDGVSVEKQRIGPDGRERVPFTLTREQLGRVVEGIGEADGE